MNNISFADFLHHAKLSTHFNPILLGLSRVNGDRDTCTVYMVNSYQHFQSIFLQQISFASVTPSYTRSPKRTSVICWCCPLCYPTNSFKALKGNISSSVT